MNTKAIFFSTLVFATWASARADEQPASAFGARVDVSVVNVEVFVTDRDGQAVTGLTQEDFVILQDGEPVEISNFYAATRLDPVDEALTKTIEELRAEPPRVEERRRDDQQLNLVVYIDHFNLRPASRKRVLDSLDDFLDTRSLAGDNVMLVGFNRGVEVVQSFTRDPELIRRGLTKLGKAAAHGLIKDAERRRTLRSVADAARLGELGEAHAFVRQHIQQLQSELRLTGKAMQDVLRSLAGLPGRKALIYVSDGLPARPGEAMLQQLADLFGTQALGADLNIVDPAVEAMRESQGSLFNQIIREANAQQVTFYTIDARGHFGGGTLSAVETNQSPGNAGNSFMAAIHDFNLQEPLIDLAVATGGSSVLNTVNFDDALTGMSADFDTFYSLGYQLPEGGDGRFRKIEVVVRHPDYKVRHREGFMNKPEEERIADRTISSLFLASQDNPLGIGLTFGVPDQEAKRRFKLPIMVRIPLEGVTFLPTGEQQEARLKIFVAVQDEKGNLSDIHTQPYPMSVPAARLAAAKGQDAGWTAELRVRPGTANIAVGVWDEIAGTTSYHQERVLVGPSRGAGR